ncbi:hypothetical protein SPRG_06109 [Saprolegnia parasitica CBS 223.65]|uniref:Uncharacterized protein n=1 Tax=Saprolegnia parasitica (strain CBS 223.65) TaxID=695850 RepID=A0A067CE70_SAPPC|nr:hypothetical protein SPRG_06109 [Saprolegnia parasitica CBS 223.65]KDO29054.1 hypothetical protein SPRG_06109 [Saprolegnia parasitica CBS 223.65]|eukprot:XP_012200224.1 hypothetical protein SPRG_06109 [Saprolegnia parasitica CBS 223.65]
MDTQQTQTPGGIPDLVLDSDVFTLDFHPQRNIVATGLINGSVQAFAYAPEGHASVLSLSHHQDACRKVMFSEDGNTLYTASTDKSIRAYDTTGGVMWAELNAHAHPVNSMHQISNNIFTSGDDQGCIKMWDVRQHRCVVEWNEHTDYISDMTTNDAKDTLLATGGDGRLSVYDLKKNAFVRKSDELDDELLSVRIVKGGKKVVCGSQDGVLVIFSWGTWGDMSDRFPGHPDSVETILKVDEDTILTGSSDGIIRVVQIHPNKLLGLIGDHEDFPVEVLEFSHDRRIVGSVSHSDKVQFWDVGYLFDEDDEDDDDDDGQDAAGLSFEPKDDESMDDSDDDSDDDDNGQAFGRKAAPTQREAFFSDL